MSNTRRTRFTVQLETTGPDGHPRGDSKRLMMALTIAGIMATILMGILAMIFQFLAMIFQF
jgi:hypothetical protein